MASINYYNPMNKHSGCIIVPYRDRAEHLAKFLPHYMGVLPIVVVEQADEKPFNRGKLLNIGVLETEYDYYVLHDVDMLAETMEQYSYYPENPTHLASAASQFGYRVPYEEYFGGVTSVAREHIIKANGFPNECWGWGAEDDIFRMRLKGVDRIGNLRYISLHHERDINWELHEKNVQRMLNDNPNDGLTSCTYEIISRTEHYGYNSIKTIL
jgi:hypothetical protein